MIGSIDNVARSRRRVFGGIGSAASGVGALALLSEAPGISHRAYLRWFGARAMRGRMDRATGPVLTAGHQALSAETGCDTPPSLRGTVGG